MKPTCVCFCSAILGFFLPIPALTQIASVQATGRDAETNIEKYNTNIKLVDEKLKAAADMMHAQPPNYGQAIAILTEASQMAPDQDGVWYRLAVAYLGSADAQADGAEKTRGYTEAYSDLEKAVDLSIHRKSQELQDSSKVPCNVEGVCTHVERVKGGAISDNYKLAVYYSDLGDAAAKLGKHDEAIKDFQHSAQLDPADAGTYYFNEGIILRNAAKSMDERKQAAAAFDRAIAADPNKAADYYLKGEVLFGMTTADSEGKLIPPPGAVEAFQKYLQLEPNGPYADRAKSFLAALSTTDNRTYKKE